MAYKDKQRKTAYQNAFIDRSYDRVNLTLKKGQKAIIKEHAEKYDGGSVNAFITRAIKETMERDKEKTDEKEPWDKNPRLLLYKKSRGEGAAKRGEKDAKKA